MISGYSDIFDFQASALYNNVAGWETAVLRRIGNQIKAIGKMTPEQVKALNNIALVKQDMSAITKELAKITGRGISDISKMYGDTISRMHAENRHLYDYRNKVFTPFSENRELQAMVRAFAKTTGGTMINLSKTSMLGMVDRFGEYNDIQRVYTQAIDKAVMVVSSGATDFHSAMRDTIEDIGGSGVRIHYGSGIARRLDTVVRQNLLWGAKQVSTQYDEMIGDELGCDGIEIDWHSDPRPSHEFMQGKQYALGGAKTVNGVYFEDASKALDALEDYGCLHYKTSIICGVSEPRYDAKELERLNEQNRQTYEIGDKTMTGYEASQAMRQLETEIRKQNDILSIAKASGDDVLVERCKERIRIYKGKYGEISDITGIAREPKRMGRA